MSKFIIDIEDDVGDYEAINALLDVIALGRIFKNNTMYCHHTEIYNGINVTAIERTKDGKSDKFIIHLNKPKKK